MTRNTTLEATLLACLAVLAGCAGGSPTSEAAQTTVFSEAACAFGPAQTDLRRVAPGEGFRIHEEAFSADCYDTGPEGRPLPERDVPIGLRQGDAEGGILCLGCASGYHAQPARA